jgi:cytochrome c peroxidase
MKRNISRMAAVAAALSVAGIMAMDSANAVKTDNQWLSPKAQLGRVLFFDSALSEPAGQSCASCHDPGRAFVDPDKNAITSKGVIPPLVGSRNAPSSMYMAFSPKFRWDEKEALYLGGQFWDGRASTLEEQAKGPFVNPLEMANPDRKSVVAKVRRASYAPMFEQVFGKDALKDDDKAYDRIAEALAEFQRTPQFAPFTSKYDAYLAGKAKLTKQEMRGLRLFEREDKGNCAACHPSKPGPRGEPPLFTDFSYDNLGVPRNPDNPFYKLSAKFNPAGELFVDRGLGAALNKQSEDGKFKVPTLRNIALTGPYMHNGYFRPLEGVTAFYNDRDVRPLCGSNRVSEAEALKQKCWPAPEVISNVNKDELGDLKLTRREVADIVAFMKTLTDGWQPGK